MNSKKKKKRNHRKNQYTILSNTAAATHKGYRGYSIQLCTRRVYLDPLSRMCLLYIYFFCKNAHLDEYLINRNVIKVRTLSCTPQTKKCTQRRLVTVYWHQQSGSSEERNLDSPSTPFRLLFYLVLSFNRPWPLGFVSSTGSWRLRMAEVEAEWVNHSLSACTSLALIWVPVYRLNSSDACTTLCSSTNFRYSSGYGASFPSTRTTASGDIYFMLFLRSQRAME
jgi:hypothetical protein